MAIYDDRLGDIVDKLGRYFSIVSKEDFMAILAFGDDDAVGDFGNVNLDPTPPLQKVIRAFTNTTEGGVTLIQGYQGLVDLMTGSPSGEISDMVKLAQKLYRFTGEPDAFESIPLPSGVGDRMCGEDGGCVVSRYSIKDCLKITTEGEGQINGVFASPTKFTPNVCALQVLSPKLTPARRDTGAAALFMTSLPTLELSRCQPYLDITVISPMAGLGEDLRIQSMGLMQFLLGSSQVPEETADYYLSTGLDQSALYDFEQRRDTADAQAAAFPPGDDANSDEDPGISTSGMEMFCAPQTLVPVIGTGPQARMERYEDYEAFQLAEGQTENDSPAMGGRRGAGIIDPFRPMMTIESFSVSVTPSKGFMSHETAELSLIMHDRSRISEIAAFVKPDMYGQTEILITYGWSHPDPSGMTDPSTGNIQGNFFGAFLNLMKVTKKYMVINSSFSFDDVGQVNIKLKLSMKGSANIHTSNLSQGEDVDDVLKTMKDLQDAIKVIKKQIMDDAQATGDTSAAKDMFGSSFMAAASDTSKAMTVDKETADAIKKFIASRRNTTSPGDASLRDTLKEMFGSTGTGGVAAAAKATIADAVAGKVAHLKSMRRNGKDPFARTVVGAHGSTKYVNARYNDSKFVSLGAMLLYMVGKPLASTRRFDEIQFIFYPVNDKASYLAGLTVADIPIKMEDFEKKFTERTKTTVNIPIGAFMGFVSKEFVHNQTAYVYGLTKLYSTDEEGKTEMKEKFKEDATKLNDEKKKRLEDAYGEGADIEFKMPRIKMEMQAVPCKVGTHPLGREGTILRVHVYDSVCGAYPSLMKMMTAARSDSIGMLSSAAGGVPGEVEDADSPNGGAGVDHTTAFIDGLQAAMDAGIMEPVPATTSDPPQMEDIDLDETYFRMKGGFPALKNFMMGSMPSIIYGSSNSAVLSADLSSMNNSKLASVNMLRAGGSGGDAAQGSRDAGLPLQTTPVSLSLTTYGCPVISYGQQFFVDFGTGTTIDNVFVVTGIDHTIEQGKYETKLKMTQVDAFGKYISMFGNVKQALTALSES